MRNPQRLPPVLGLREQRDSTVHVIHVVEVEDGGVSRPHCALRAAEDEHGADRRRLDPFPNLRLQFRN